MITNLTDLSNIATLGGLSLNNVGITSISFSHTTYAYGFSAMVATQSRTFYDTNCPTLATLVWNRIC
jgi:hypothetical protein